MFLDYGDAMNILVTIDKNYLSPLKTMLFSLFLNQPRTRFQIFLIHDNITTEDLEILESFCLKHQSKLFCINGSSLFQEAPVVKHYSSAMYYRLLAYKLLPENIDKILYLDPDLLIINPLDELYDIDFGHNLFAAASHVDESKILGYANQIRLNGTSSTKTVYYNSGVLLMNLNLQRQMIKEEDIYEYVRNNKAVLFLPDQDILNALYGTKILKISDMIYNYDVRYYKVNLLRFNGEIDINWILKNTSILHFCGKRKPWQKSYSGRFKILYAHYYQLAKRAMMID